MSHEQVKVSVVVAVYNPGVNIEGLITSLADQSLPPEQLEVIFVDDGSTDDTPARLQQAAAEYLNMRVTTIPNSGWPGRPRNVGTDLARGDYVFYCDHDDEFFPEALERMYELGHSAGADIVYGKVVRTGRPTPYWPLARRTIAVADPVADQLAVSRTVHKLFRREWVLEHGMRFPEGKVRLEDHNFMGQALPRARVVSVLADYPCYRWIHRPDGTNNSSAKVSQKDYWGYFGQALDVFAATAGEGPLLDSARVIAVGQMFSRFGPAEYLSRPAKKQETTVDAVHRVLATHAPPALDERLGVMRRVRVQALRAGDTEHFNALQAARLELDIEVRAEAATWAAGALLVHATATLRSTGRTRVRSAGSDQTWQLDLGADLNARVDALSGDRARLLGERDLGRVELTVRHRESGVEWPVPCIVSRRDQPGPDGELVPGLRVEGRVDPTNGTFGQRLDDGIWDVLARAEFLGEGATGAVRFAGRPPGGSPRLDLRTARAYVTKGGKLALQLTPAPTGATLDKGARVTGASWLGGQLSLTVSGAPSHGASVLVRPRSGALPGAPVPTGAVQRGQVRVDLGSMGEGWHDAYLRLESATGVLDERLRLGSVTIAQHPPYAVGCRAEALSVRRLGPGEVVPADLVSRPAQASSRFGEPALHGLVGRLSAAVPVSARPLARRLRRRLSGRR